MKGLGSRPELWERAQSGEAFDLAIIGGGATGLGIALHAAASGLKTILVERADFAQGTSSRSTKLIHGGVRYLQQGNIRLVKEALRERGLLMQNAPHLVNNMEFVIPSYRRWKRWYYALGLKVYDRLAGRLGLGRSLLLDPRETVTRLPGIQAFNLRGGVSYHDGQFDDAQLALSLAMTAAEHGALLLNHAEVTEIIHTNGKASGIKVVDRLGNAACTLACQFLVNATGAFSDAVMRIDRPDHAPVIRPSQGVHLVVDNSFFPGNIAMLIPKTDDGRVLFAVPWHGRVILGTTDTLIESPAQEPIPKDVEIDFILRHIARYLKHSPTRKDVLSAFAGIRPLVKTTDKKTSELARDHVIRVSKSGMISILGGKWTTYRKMAADVMRKIHARSPEKVKLVDTRMLRLVDFNSLPRPASIEGLSTDDLAASVELEARQRLCMTVEDYLARRTRQLLLDARYAMERAPEVAHTLARVHQRDATWIEAQLSQFQSLALQYLPTHSSTPSS